MQDLVHHSQWLIRESRCNRWLTDGAVLILPRAGASLEDDGLFECHVAQQLVPRTTPHQDPQRHNKGA